MKSSTNDINIWRPSPGPTPQSCNVLSSSINQPSPERFGLLLGTPHNNPIEPGTEGHFQTLLPLQVLFLVWLTQLSIVYRWLDLEDVDSWNTHFRTLQRCPGLSRFFRWNTTYFLMEMLQFVWIFNTENKMLQ